MFGQVFKTLLEKCVLRKIKLQNILHCNLLDHAGSRLAKTSSAARPGPG
jgi:hypothetical protein